MPSDGLEEVLLSTLRDYAAVPRNVSLRPGRLPDGLSDSVRRCRSSQEGQADAGAARSPCRLPCQMTAGAEGQGDLG